MSFAYFTLAELRALPDLSGQTYTDTQLTGAADWIESLVESVCNTSFVPRPRTDVLNGNDQNNDGVLLLRAGYATSVTSLTQNGVTVSVGDVLLTPAGRIQYRTAGSYGVPSRWAYGVQNITVAYVAGYSTTVPADLKDAMLAAARAHIIGFRSQSGVPDRALSIANDFGNVSLATPGAKFPTGLPWADAVINRWADTTNILGFA